MPWWLPFFKNTYRRDGWSPEEKSVARATAVLCLVIFLFLLFVLLSEIVIHFGKASLNSIWPVIPLLVAYLFSAIVSGGLVRLFAPALFKTADANAKIRLAGKSPRSKA